MDYNTSVGQHRSCEYVMKTESCMAWHGTFPLVFWKLRLAKLLLALVEILVSSNKATRLFCPLCISQFVSSAIQSICGASSIPLRLHPRQLIPPWLCSHWMTHGWLPASALATHSSQAFCRHLKVTVQSCKVRAAQKVQVISLHSLHHELKLLPSRRRFYLPTGDIWRPWPT